MYSMYVVRTRAYCSCGPEFPRPCGHLYVITVEPARVGAGKLSLANLEVILIQNKVADTISATVSFVQVGFLLSRFPIQWVRPYLCTHVQGDMLLFFRLCYDHHLSFLSLRSDLLPSRVEQFSSSTIASLSLPPSLPLWYF